MLSRKRTYAPRIVRLLATYIRGNFPAENLEFSEPPFTRATPRLDLQRAVDTIGRIHKLAVEQDPSNWRLDLRSCNFDGCLFQHCLLNFASFRRAVLTGGRFDHVILNDHIAGITPSLNLEKLTGATFIGADISALDYLGSPKVIEKTFGTKDTQTSYRLAGRPVNNKHEIASTLFHSSNSENLTEHDQQLITEIRNTGFINWSPFDSTDGATGQLLKKLWNKLDMDKWPYNSAS